MILMSIIEKLAKRRDYVKYLRKKGCKIGEGCEIYLSANFGSEPYLIAIGNHVRVNSDVNFISHDGGVWVVRQYLKSTLNEAEKIDMFGKIEVGNNVHIGTNATIMPGVKIGDNCIIGCGAIVTYDVPDNSVAVGVPARVIETLDEYIEKNKDDFVYTKSMSAKGKRQYLLKKYTMEEIEK